MTDTRATAEEVKRLVYRLRTAIRNDSGAGAGVETYEAAIDAEETLLTAIDSLASRPVPEQPGVREALKLWPDAYKAFVGAFDTPQMRRSMPDEYSTDARKRLREFDAALAAQPVPQGEPR